VEKTNVVDRSGLYSVQTPQGFRPELIYAASSKSKNTDVTDDASLIEKTAQRVASVEGEVHNIKITTPADLKQARWIINSMNHVRIK
jgi:2-C-methyl-D-erythritol 4-phosphate cytidylyltransferase